MPPNPKEIPFIRFLIPLIFGIIFGYYYQLPTLWCWGLPCALLIPLLTFAYFSLPAKFKFSYFLWPLLFFFFLGQSMVSIELAEKRILPQNVENIEQYIVELQGTIKKGKYLQATGKLIHVIKEERESKPISGAVHLTFEFNGMDSLAVGNRIGFSGKVAPIARPKNPHTFDFKAFKANEGISHSAFVKKEYWQVLSAQSKNDLPALALQIQAKLSGALAHYISGPNELAVANSLILGNRKELDQTLRKAYSATGALHVLAVSGLHVGIIYVLIIFFLKKLKHKKHKWIKLIIVLAGIWSFVLITGAAPSVIRAATMFSLMGIGNALQRYPNIYNILGQAAFLMLLINPLLIFNISFQLSFSAVFSIVFFQPKIYKYWIIDNWFGDHIWKLISLGIAAQIGTLPISLYYFHQFPLFFWLSGIIVVPAASVILLAGIALLFLHFTIPVLAVLLGKMLGGFIWLMNACIFSLEKLPGSSITDIYISPFLVLLLYLGILLIIFSNTYKWRKGIYLGFALLGMTFIPGWLKAIAAKSQHKIIIYHQSYSTLIDHWIANKGTFHLEGPITEEKITQTASGARAANLIRESIPWSIKNKHIYEKYSILNFNSERIVCLKEFPTIAPSSPIQAKGIIIQNTPDMDWEKFNDFFSVEFVVADGSNKPWITKRWAEELSTKEQRFKFWDTSTQGAFQLDLNQ